MSETAGRGRSVVDRSVTATIVDVSVYPCRRVTCGPFPAFRLDYAGRCQSPVQRKHNSDCRQPMALPVDVVCISQAGDGVPVMVIGTSFPVKTSPARHGKWLGSCSQA
jgi:hypothetical protein